MKHTFTAPARVLAGIAMLTWGAVGAAAQSTVVVRVGTTQNGVKFEVNGIQYQTTQTFNWPVGSKQVLSLTRQQFAESSAARFTFSGWQANGSIAYGATPEITITVDTSLQSIIAQASLEYALELQMPECPSMTARCAWSPGRVAIGGGSYYGGGRLWQAAGTQLTLQAEAFEGFVFEGWNGTVGNGLENSIFAQIVMNGPRFLSPRFSPAKRVDLITEPPALSVLVDRAPVRTPSTVDWPKGSPRLLGGATQRNDRGAMFVFDRWEGLPSAGPGEPVVYTPSVTDNTVSTLKAIFIPGTNISFNTNPPGLRLRVGGRDNWTNYNFEWGIGREVTVEAPAEQVDRDGRRWVFDGWSNGGTATQTLVVPSAGFNIVARYRRLSRLTFDTNPSGLPLTVNGNVCRTPCNIDGEPEAAARVSAATVIPQGEFSRFELAGWSIGGEGAEQTVRFPSDRQNVVANFVSAHRIRMTSNPPQAGEFSFEPASTDGYWRTGTTVQVTAGAARGFKFRRWEGELQGTFASLPVVVNGPRFAVANYDEVPFADPTGVRNAAGVTPDAVVAPGSQAAIIGANLATDTIRGSESPLAQAVGGVVARLGSRLLPIFWVSPERVDLQIPSDIEPGAYQITVSRAGQPDVTSDLNVARNAPGIFTRDDPKPGEPGLGFAIRRDGSAVTATAPAAAGDEITLLATGCGPYDLRAPDGFNLPTDLTFRLVDPVEVLIGGQTIAPTFAGGNGGQIGVNAIRFRVPAGVSGSVQIRLKSGGRESNTVVLPVR